MKRVLIANRGEIAVRITDGLREAGITAVVVHSEADRSAFHVRHADEAVEIGPAPAAESYLNIDRVVEAAKESRCEAVHPGYGFLAENAAFARAVGAAGLVFLGPRPETIELLGDKRAARAVAGRARVPVVPGWEGSPENLGEAVAAANEMGWPVLVKAALGGGGKGMTIVREAAELEEALSTAARIASSAFGDAAVYFEKAIERPRHVEVQILGDGKGNVVHLGERECTLQRRHQKILEESPSPTIEESTRTALTEAAVAIGREVEYRSAGTCEFLVDENEGFYFLEVNARIQVEHPVTELVTGKDLVAEQLFVAREGALSFSQAEVELRGSAIEVRLYAEDADTGFLPQAGRLLRVDFPRAPGLRIDTGAESGDEVPTHYDPMIAKIIASGGNRDLALRRLRTALAETVVHGPITNLGFLRELVDTPEVETGEVDTNWVENVFLARRQSSEAAQAESKINSLSAAAALADAFDLLDEVGSIRSGAGPDRRLADPFDTLTGFRIQRSGGAA